MTRVRFYLLSTIAACSLLLAPAAARANHTQESLFQDDEYLLYSPTATVNHTLQTLHSLGAQRVRINVLWSALAPDSTSQTRPPNFDATNPADYSAAAWAPYDRLVVNAAKYHVGIEFNITDPGPLWAMQHNSPTARAAAHWMPNGTEFFYFAQALGKRYSGTYDSLPRVNVWSIWNEPNQPGWLAPQSRSFKGKEVSNSPRLYRQYVEDGFAALYVTGHVDRKDTILIGELAPEGDARPGFYNSITPMPFLRALYCLDRRYRPLRGTAAAALGCPAHGPRHAFVRANPGLFEATGFAHHPYNFYHAPGVRSSNPNFAPLANLGRLEHGLDSAFHAYGVNRRLPLYLTEYGYGTNPPNPYEIVTPAEQAAYINQADYIAWRDSRVRSVSQFLLYDSAPNPMYKRSDRRYWDTFQTGLLTLRGKRKPAYAAYEMPIWIPSPRVRPGAPVFIWGQLRAASHAVGQRAKIQWRGSSGNHSRRGRFRTIATVITRNPSGYLTTNLRLPGSGTIQIAWRSPSGQVLVSRSVSVSVG